MLCFWPQNFCMPMFMPASACTYIAFLCADSALLSACLHRKVVAFGIRNAWRWMTPPSARMTTPRAGRAKVLQNVSGLSPA